MVTGEANAPKPADRLLYIEGMRGIAATYVALQHICTMIDPYRGLQRPGAQPEWLAAVTTPLWYGHLAVAAFIVISGFCLQLALFGRGDGRLKDLRGFLVRRCRRILPPYYACLTISIVVALTVTQKQQGQPWIQYLPVTPENVLAHLLMIHNWSVEWMYKINGVLWSIAIEFQLYFLFPLFVLALWKRGAVLLLTVAMALTLALIAVFPVAQKLYVWYVPLFILGMVAARDAFVLRFSDRSVSFVGMIAVAGIAASGFLVSVTKSLIAPDMAMGIGTAALLLYGKLRPEALPIQLLASRALAFVGTFSYSLYLMHHPIMQVLFVTRPSVVSTSAREFVYLLALGMPIIFALCYLFFLAFEKPFISNKRRVAA